MTVPKEKPRHQYEGPYKVGETAPIPFGRSADKDIKIIVSSDNGPQQLEYNIDYEVIGGNIRFLIEIPDAAIVTLYRETSRDNEAAFPQEAKFDSNKINAALDKTAMTFQEIDDDLSRAIKLSKDASTAIKDLTVPAPDAGKSLQWNKTGTGLENSKFSADEAIQLTEDNAERSEVAAGEAEQSKDDAQTIVQNGQQAMQQGLSQAGQIFDNTVTEANRANTEANRSKAEADRSKSEADRSQGAANQSGTGNKLTQSVLASPDVDTVTLHNQPNFIYGGPQLREPNRATPPNISEEGILEMPAHNFVLIPFDHKGREFCIETEVDLEYTSFVDATPSKILFSMMEKPAGQVVSAALIGLSMHVEPGNAATGANSNVRFNWTLAGAGAFPTQNRWTFSAVPGLIKLKIMWVNRQFKIYYKNIPNLAVYKAPLNYDTDKWYLGLCVPAHIIFNNINPMYLCLATRQDATAAYVNTPPSQTYMQNTRILYYNAPAEGEQSAPPVSGQVTEDVFQFAPKILGNYANMIHADYNPTLLTITPEGVSSGFASWYRYIKPWQDYTKKGVDRYYNVNNIGAGYAEANLEERRLYKVKTPATFNAQPDTLMSRGGETNAADQDVSVWFEPDGRLRQYQGSVTDTYSATAFPASTWVWIYEERIGRVSKMRWIIDQGYTKDTLPDALLWTSGWTTAAQATLVNYWEPWHICFGRGRASAYRALTLQIDLSETYYEVYDNRNGVLGDPEALMYSWSWKKPMPHHFNEIGWEYSGARTAKLKIHEHDLVVFKEHNPDGTILNKTVHIPEQIFDCGISNPGWWQLVYDDETQSIAKVPEGALLNLKQCVLAKFFLDGPRFHKCPYLHPTKTARLADAQGVNIQNGLDNNFVTNLVPNYTKAPLIIPNVQPMQMPETGWLYPVITNAITLSINYGPNITMQHTYPLFVRKGDMVDVTAGTVTEYRLFPCRGGELTAESFFLTQT